MDNENDSTTLNEEPPSYLNNHLKNQDPRNLNRAFGTCYNPNQETFNQHSFNPNSQVPVHNQHQMQMQNEQLKFQQAHDAMVEELNRDYQTFLGDHSGVVKS